MIQNNNGIHTGTPSILLILVSLSLVSFATLSFTSARADALLNHKITEKTTSYYNACNLAEKDLANMDQTLSYLFYHCKNETEYFRQAGHSKSFMYSLSDNQRLLVNVSIHYPTKENSYLYTINTYKVCRK